MGAGATVNASRASKQRRDNLNMSFPLSGAPHSRWFAVAGLQACGPAVFPAAVRLARNGPGCMPPPAAATPAAVPAPSLSLGPPNYKLSERHKRVEAGL